MRSSFLDYITVRGFKSIASLEKLPLKPINILIGANGSGKSNFIGVFAFLRGELKLVLDRLRRCAARTLGHEDRELGIDWA